MVLPRPTMLRASSIARCARSARYIRAAERQPWQQMVQRTARRSYASSHGSTGSTIKGDLPWAIGAVAATVGGLWVVFQQDFGHGESHEGHDEHSGHAEKHEEAEEEAPAEDEDESKDDSKDDDKDGKKGEYFSAKDEDKPDARKEAGSPNTTSGKQEGMSNQDTHHSTNIDDNPNKSSKGEGVAETAKLKGTVKTDRPMPENKDEQGKSSMDKSK